MELLQRHSLSACKQISVTARQQCIDEVKFIEEMDIKCGKRKKVDDDGISIDRRYNFYQDLLSLIRIFIWPYFCISYIAKDTDYVNSTDEESCSTNSGPQSAICQFFRATWDQSDRSASPLSTAESAICVFCQAKCDAKIDNLTAHLRNSCALVPWEVKERYCLSPDALLPAPGSHTTAAAVDSDDKLDHAYTLCLLSSSLGETNT